jgi:hypothetical protein
VAQRNESLLSADFPILEYQTPSLKELTIGVFIEFFGETGLLPYRIAAPQQIMLLGEDWRSWNDEQISVAP